MLPPLSALIRGRGWPPPLGNRASRSGSTDTCRILRKRAATLHFVSDDVISMDRRCCCRCTDLSMLTTPPHAHGRLHGEHAEVRGLLALYWFRRHHKITVIPMHSSQTTANQLLPATQQLLHPDLPRLTDLADVGRESLVKAFRAAAEIKESLEEEYWLMLFKQVEALRRTFLPIDVALIFSVMARCKQRNVRAVQLLNQQLRRIDFSLSITDVARIFSAYQQMGWKSKDTIRRLTTQFLRDIESAMPFHLRNVLPVFPALRISVDEDPQTKTLFKQVGDRAVQLVRLLEPRDFAVILNSFVRSNQTHSLLFDVSSKHVTPMVPQMTNMQLAVVVNAYARAGCRSLALLRAVSEEARKRAFTLEPQDLSNILNAFAKLDFIEPRLFTDAAPAVCQKIKQFSPQGLANVAHAFGKAGIKNEVLFERIGKLSVTVMHRFSAQEMANLANAYARLDLRDKALFASLSDELIYRGTIGRGFKQFRFDIRSIEQLANASAKLGLRDKRVFFVLTFLLKKALTDKTHSAQTAALIDGQTVSTLLNAFGRARMKMRLFGPLITQQAMAHKWQLSTVSIANMLNACHKIDIKHRALFTSLMQIAKGRLEQFSPLNLVVLLRSLGKLDLYRRSVVKRALKISGLYLAQLDGSALCALAQALGDLRYRDPEFLQRLSIALRAKLYDMSPRDVCVALNAYIRLRVLDTPLYDVLLKHVFEKQHQLRAQDLLLACHTLPLVEEASYNWDPALLHSLLTALLPHRNSLHVTSIRLLQGVELCLRALRPAVYDGLPFPLKDFLRKVRKVSVGSHDYMALSSTMHREVSKYFTAMGLYHRSEVRVGPYSLDIVLGKRTVVEVDGESHFYRDTQMRTAKSVLKHKVLEAMGWRVFHVSFLEWTQCVTARRKISYCAFLWKHLLPEGEESPADGAGLRVGDVIGSRNQLPCLLAPPGQQLLRRNTEEEVSVPSTTDSRDGGPPAFYKLSDAGEDEWFQQEKNATPPTLDPQLKEFHLDFAQPTRSHGTNSEPRGRRAAATTTAADVAQLLTEAQECELRADSTVSTPLSSGGEAYQSQELSPFATTKLDVPGILTAAYDGIPSTSTDDDTLRRRRRRSSLRLTTGITPTRVVTHYCKGSSMLQGKNGDINSDDVGKQECRQTASEGSSDTQ